MRTPLKVAVIGKGRWGTNIIRTLELLPSCEVIFGSTEELLQRGVDAVCIATPSPTHAPIALPFIKRGIPTFIEKPLTTSLADARALLAAAKKYKTQVCVGHVHLYNPAFEKLLTLLPTLGPIRVIVSESGGNGPYRSDTSALWDWAPHDIAMMLSTVGTLPTTVQAWGTTLLTKKKTDYDITHLKLLFPGKVVGLITNSRLTPEKRRLYTVIGQKHTIVFDDTASEKLTLYRNFGPTLSKKGERTYIERQEPQLAKPPHATELPLTQELRSFIDSISNKKETKSPASQGFAVVAILDAAERSIQKGGTKEKVPLR